MPIQDERNSPAKQDMHPADIKAALQKRGYSFSRIAREYGYRANSPSNVLRMPWAPMEKIIGDILGTPPDKIWPSRYDSQGRPLRSRFR
ncbi:helix-turn-helix domain-containing protein [uncultured Desulfuromonas sp.]|uniref:helix-turn-helix domain-containing protein n=1 Tax=uncultured Desulfuromonas sp. TaxID=181013 RepID=UPI002AAAA05D|nr:helix-turn-helix domain-containing protein [uncultured Desulfuromonas sp.]